MTAIKHIFPLFILTSLLVVSCKKDSDFPPVKVLPEGNIITQIRKGYKLHDRLLRAANVIVSKGPEKDSESSEEEGA